MAEEHQKTILDLCESQAEGVAEAAILSSCGTTKDSLAALNALLRAHRLALFNASDGSRVFKAVGESDAVRKKGLAPEEHLVYQEISKTANAGIWIKDLRKRTGLNQTSVARYVKNLESRQLIKAVKSVNYANRKYYMLFELEPSQQVTGGAWYTEHEFDKDFIDVLYEQCYLAIQNRGTATIEEVMESIKESGVTNEDLQPQDISALVQTLVYDGRVQLDPTSQEEDSYRPARVPPLERSAFSAVPCGVCPVIEECTPDGHISPATCIYMNDWLDF